MTKKNPDKKPREVFMQYEPRTPLPRRYSIAKVKRLYKEIYALDVINIDYGYKGNRYRPYVHYRVMDHDGNIVMDRVTLNALGDHLVDIGEYD